MNDYPGGDKVLSGPSGRATLALYSLAARYARIGLTIATSLMVTPIVLYHLGQERYGIWVTLTTIVGYVALADLGISGALVRHVAYVSGSGSKSDVTRLASSAFSVYVIIGTVAWLVGLSTYWLLRRWAPQWLGSGDDWQTALVLLFASACLGLPFRTFESTLRGLQRQYTVETIGAGAALVNAFATVAVLRAGWGLAGLAFVTLAMSLVQGLITWLSTLRLGVRVDLLRNVDKNAVRALVSFSVYLFINSLAVAMVFNTDNIVTSAVIGASAVTVYRLTYQPAQLLVHGIMQVSDAAFPGLTATLGAGDWSAFRRTCLRLIEITGMLAWPGAALYAVTNNSFVSAWVGPQNYAGLAVTLVFASLVIIHTYLHVWSNILQALGRVQGLAWVSLAEGVLKVGLSLWLAQRIGLVGVALGTLVANVCTSGWYVQLTAARALGLSWTDVLGRLRKPVAFAAAIGGIAWVTVAKLESPRLGDLAIVSAVVLLIYAGVVWRWGLSTAERVALARAVSQVATALRLRRAHA